MDLAINNMLNLLKKILKILAKATLWRYKPTVVGITGNVGKTSAKEAACVVLGHTKKVRGSPKSFNNEVGLPLAILGDWEETGGVFFWFKVFLTSFFRIIFKSRRYPEILILEYGIDRPGDMRRLLNIARPTIAAVTAIGDIPVHVEFFAGKEALAREKSKIIGQLPSTGFALVNTDDIEVNEMKNHTRAQVMTFGFANNADIRISNFELTDVPGLTFKLNYGGSFIPVRLNGVLGRAQAYSAAVAAGLGLIFGMNLVDIAEALGHYHSPAGRLKVIPGIKDSVIIDDTYNAAPLSTHAALDVLRHIEAKRRIAVLGDMLEIGKYTLEAHEEIGGLAAKSADILVTIGNRAKFIAEGAIKAGKSKKSIYSFLNLKEAGLFVQSKVGKGDVVLVKGSQAVRMEKIVKELMAEPERAGELLVRQNKTWLARKGMYE